MTQIEILTSKDINVVKQELQESIEGLYYGLNKIRAKAPVESAEFAQYVEGLFDSIFSIMNTCALIMKGQKIAASQFSSVMIIGVEHAYRIWTTVPIIQSVAYDELNEISNGWRLMLRNASAYIELTYPDQTKMLQDAYRLAYVDASTLDDAVKAIENEAYTRADIGASDLDRAIMSLLYSFDLLLKAAPSETNDFGGKFNIALGGVSKIIYSLTNQLKTASPFSSMAISETTLGAFLSMLDAGLSLVEVQKKASLGLKVIQEIGGTVCNIIYNKTTPSHPRITGQESFIRQPNPDQVVQPQQFSGYDVVNVVNADQKAAINALLTEIAEAIVKAQKAFPVESDVLGNTLTSSLQSMAAKANVSAESVDKMKQTNYAPVLIGVGLLILLFLMKKGGKKS